MQPINFPGAVVVGKPADMTDEQCMSIYAMPVDYELETPEGKVPARFWIEAWKPNREGIEAIKRGEPIYIRICSAGLPPVSVFTLDENGECNDVG